MSPWNKASGPRSLNSSEGTEDTDLQDPHLIYTVSRQAGKPCPGTLSEVLIGMWEEAQDRAQKPRSTYSGQRGSQAWGSLDHS